MGEAKRRKAKDPNYGKTRTFEVLSEAILLALCAQELELSHRDKVSLSLFIAMEWRGKTDCCFVDAMNWDCVECYCMDAHQLVPILLDEFNKVKEILENGQKCIVIVLRKNNMAEYRIIAF